MNPVLVRRLLGAGCLLLLLFIVSVLLPSPRDPRPAEPGMHRVDVDVNDAQPIVNPVHRTDVPVTTDAAPQPPVPAPTAPLPQRSVHLASTTTVPAASRPSATTAAPAQDDDDLAAAPGADSPVSDEPVDHHAPAPAPATPQSALVARPAAEPAVSAANHSKPAPAVAAPTPPKPAVAAVAPSPAPMVTPAVKPATDKPAPKPVIAPPIPMPAPKGHWVVQAGSYADIANARQIQAQLQSLGFSASIVPTESGGSALYRVRSGSFATRDEAEAARQRIQQNHIPASVAADGG